MLDNLIYLIVACMMFVVVGTAMIAAMETMETNAVTSSTHWTASNSNPYHKIHEVLR